MPILRLEQFSLLNLSELHSDKTEVIVLGLKHLRETLSDDLISVDGITLACSSTVRNVGIIFDQDMSFVPYIKQVSFLSPLQHYENQKHPVSRGCRKASQYIWNFQTGPL